MAEQTTTAAQDANNGNGQKEANKRSAKKTGSKSYRFRKLEKRPQVSPQALVNILNTVTENNDFDKKFFEAIFYSLMMPKNKFVEKIRDDLILLAKFMKYFPGAVEYINYTDLTLLGHILLYCLVLKDLPIADEVRNKIGGNDIWSLDDYSKESKQFEIIRNTLQKFNKESIDGVKPMVDEWFNNVNEKLA
ncbi:hypothetical protein EDEG_03013 [Edhazardia aedis USNM 41457]|uniref:Uncharacterized protein n=1 Tax=Edhazardia aedis (strain USNM 41457) TaxID=1003232 RepID=J9DJ17_EDHAE|nr:hypothetical protein EDEG_03013 [Edhazardia aedis USNM 41457]|eukprot:EJW02580.1 hypothetical protein EDEG_03013 [Edhazardia aedis USNM 41457]